MDAITIEKLIEEVKLRKEIWKKDEKLHANKNSVDKLWDEIAMKVQWPKDELKNKWKNLRDYYRTKILEQKKSGSAAETQTLSWPYYRLMSFMKDQMTPKRSRSNLRRKSEDVDGEISRKQPRSNSTSTITTSATGSRLQHSNVVLLPSTANNSPSFEVAQNDPIIEALEDDDEKEFCDHVSSSTKNKKGISSADIGAQLIKLEKEKLEFMKGNKDDADTLYCLSLVNDFKKLDDLHKALFKFEIQKFFVDFQKNNNFS